MKTEKTTSYRVVVKYLFHLQAEDETDAEKRACDLLSCGLGDDWLWKIDVEKR